MSASLYTLRRLLREQARQEAAWAEERRLEEAEFMASLEWSAWELRVYDARLNGIHDRLAAL